MNIFKKSLLTLGAAMLGFTVIFVVSILVFMNSLYYEINTAGLKDTAIVLAAAIGEERLVELFTTNENMNISLPFNAAGVYRLTLIAPSGYVLWDSHVTDRLVNHIDREEVIAALENMEGIARRESISTGMRQIYYAIPVMDKQRNIIGVFRLSVSVPKFHVRISSVIYPFLIFALIMAVVVLFAILAFSRSLSTSIGRLVKITQEGQFLLSSYETGEKTKSEFTILEKSMRAFVYELNYQLENAKAESSRLEAILNGMSEAVFATDGFLNLHLVNPRARKLFNLGSHDISTMPLLEATRSTELEEAAKRVLASGTILDMELAFHSGAEQQFQVFISPLAGIVSGVVIVLEDITRLVKLERIRKDFVANVSHELRTPIQIIKGFSETLRDTVFAAGSEKNQIIHFIEIINKNAGVMENLTNDLLALAALENNSGNISKMEEYSIAVLIDQAVSLVMVQAKTKQIEIDVDCSDELCANLHGSLIVQALINLIENAIKYSSTESKIKVSAYCDAGADNNELILQVKDKGIGIPAEHQDRIFERFYRVDRSRNREAGGTGLGLSIVRHIALLHRGKVEVESRTGEGSCFRIKIPHHQSP